MYTLQDFAERYKMISTAELLEILEHPSQYQSIAVSAAKAEFDSRNLSAQDIDEARLSLADKKNKADRQNEKQEEIRGKLVNVRNVVFDTVSPVQSGISTAVKIIRITAVVFSLLVMYKIFVNFDLLVDIAKGNSRENFGFTLYFFPILVEVLANLFFWLKKKVGWLLLAFFCSYSLVEVLYGLYITVSLQFQGQSMQYFLSTPSLPAYIMMVLFYLGTILAINRQDVREIYAIKKKGIQAPLIMGGLFGIFLLVILTS